MQSKIGPSRLKPPKYALTKNAATALYNRHTNSDSEIRTSTTSVEPTRFNSESGGVHTDTTICTLGFSTSGDRTADKFEQPVNGKKSAKLVEHKHEISMRNHKIKQMRQHIKMSYSHFTSRTWQPFHAFFVRNNKRTRQHLIDSESEQEMQGWATLKHPNQRQNRQTVRGVVMMMIWHSKNTSDPYEPTHLNWSRERMSMTLAS